MTGVNEGERKRERDRAIKKETRGRILDKRGKNR